MGEEYVWRYSFFAERESIVSRPRALAASASFFL